MSFEKILDAIDGSDCSGHACAATVGEVDVDVRTGHPAGPISRVAEEGEYDLIVPGHRGHVVRDRLLGSTADRVAEHAHCPVMIVR